MLVEHLPLVFMARIGAFHGDGVGPGVINQIQDIGYGNIMVMGAFIIAPTEMDAHGLGRNIRGGGVQHFYMAGRDPAKFGHRLFPMHDMAAHG